MAKTYRSKEAGKMRAREVKKPATRLAKRVGEGKNAHSQPRGSQERKGKR
jgi:hypothetical protein